jgi:hypothetical protein
MTPIELRTLKDTVYCALVWALDKADKRVEDMANDALEIIERLEQIVEQLGD